MDEPMVDIEREDNTWHQEENWPNVHSLPTTLHLGTGDRTEEGSLTIQPLEKLSKEDTESLIDDPMKKADQLVANPESESQNRLAYLTSELLDQVRLSGTPKISINANIDRETANLTALLVDYGGDKPEIVTRGWMDSENLHSDSLSESIVPNKDYTFTWDMQQNDYVFEKGHRIGLVLAASDYEYTIRPPGGTKITVNLDQSNVTLPIVGGAPTLNVISATDIKALVKQLQENGDYNKDEQEQVAHDLMMHLTAVDHFENQKKAEKVMKHMEGFKTLLEQQKEDGLISERGYSLLKENADKLIKSQL